MSPRPDRTAVIRRRLTALAVRLKHRFDGEEGFTLIELTIVLLILGIVMTIAVPSYLTFKDSANQTAAKERLSTALKSVNSYRLDNFPGSRGDPNGSTTDNGVTGISLGALATKYDASLSTVLGVPYIIDPVGFAVTDSATYICVTAVAGRYTAAAGYYPGATGDGRISVGTTFTPGTCNAA